MGTEVLLMIQAFRELKSTDSRKAALDALVKELSPYEWRHVQDLIASRSFQFDIIGALPVELVAQIFLYLDTSTPFRLQIVSKRWNTLLRSPDVLKRAIRAWYGSAANLEDADYHLCAFKAHGIHRFRHGKYTSVVTNSYDNRVATVDRSVLIEDIFVRTSSDQRELLVNNLRTNVSWKAQGEARERIVAVAASDQLVAFATTLNVCYVYNIAGDQHAKFKLTFGMFNVLACCRRTVFCGGPFTDSAEIYMWDFDTRRGISFQIDYSQPPFAHRMDRCHLLDMAIIPNPTSSTMTVFTSHKCDSKHCPNRDNMQSSIHYACITFEGHLIATGSYPLFDIAGTCIINARPVDRCGRYALEVRARHVGEQECEQRFLQFDEALQMFTDPQCPISWVTSPQTVGARMAWWKDVFYQVFPDAAFPLTQPRDESGTILLALLGTMNNYKVQPVLYDSLSESGGRYWVKSTHLLLNDKFAVVVDDAQGTVHVVAFEGVQQETEGEH